MTWSPATHYKQMVGPRPNLVVRRYDGASTGVGARNVSGFWLLVQIKQKKVRALFGCELKLLFAVHQRPIAGCKLVAA